MRWLVGSASVLDDARHAPIIEPAAALEELELDEEGEAHDLALQALDQFDRALDGPPGREQVVDDQHPLAGADRVPPRTLASFAEPANTMWLLEHTAPCPDSSDWPGRGTSAKGTGDLCGPDGMGAGMWGFRLQKHGPVLNWCFVDGHAKALRYSALWQAGLNPPYHDMWGIWEDAGDGKPDAGQVQNGARSRQNIQNMCLYLRD